MKAIKFGLSALLFSIFLPSSFAHATFFDSYASLYTVGSYGSTTQETSFTASQQPFLYIELYQTPPAGTLNTYLVFTAWNDPNTNTYSTAEHTNSNQLWIGYPNGSINTAGAWTVEATSLNPNPSVQSFFGQTSFTVGGAGSHEQHAAPEPVGTTLFLLGGCLMGAGILHRRKLVTV